MFKVFIYFKTYNDCRIKVLRFVLKVCDVQKMKPPGVATVFDQDWQKINWTSLKSTIQCHVEENHKSIDSSQSKNTI